MSSLCYVTQYVTQYVAQYVAQFVAQHVAQYPYSIGSRARRRLPAAAEPADGRYRQVPAHPRGRGGRPHFEAIRILLCLFILQVRTDFF